MARLAGMSAAEFDAVITNRPLLEAIVAMRQKANQRWQIEATPYIGERQHNPIW